MIYTVTLNPALDKTTVVDVLEINSIGRVQSVKKESGGKGFNVSRALLRAGVKSKALGLIGGANGEELITGLKHDGLDIVDFQIGGETRINQVFMESSSRSIKINAQGPSVTKEEIKSLIHLVNELAQQDDIWVLSGSLPRDVPEVIYAELTEIIHDKEGKVFLDSSGAAFQAGLNVNPDWIKPNLVEAQAVFSNGLREVDLLEQFQELGVSGTILTLGSKGLLFATSSMRKRLIVPQIDNENVVGAGDATVAGFVYGLQKRLSPEECAKWAAAFGVAAAHSPGNCFSQFDSVIKFYELIEVQNL